MTNPQTDIAELRALHENANSALQRCMGMRGRHFSTARSLWAGDYGHRLTESLPALLDELEALRAQVAWQPIETADRAGNVWSGEILDKMVTAFDVNFSRHGPRETLMAVVNAADKHRTLPARPVTGEG
jgi:hypothetical protein